MIPYKSDLFGLRTLYVLHGSAAFRAFLPSFCSTGLLLVYKYFLGEAIEGTVKQPYVIAVFIVFFSFLLIIRLNYSYQRYWEAATQIHQMSSKWLDSAICLASFHYQCQQYDDSRPLTFGRNPKSYNETRERERLQNQTLEETENMIHKVETSRKGGFFRRFVKRNPKDNNTTQLTASQRAKTFKPNRKSEDKQKNYYARPSTDHQKPSSKGWRTSFASSKGKEATKRVLRLTGLDTTVPSLFLQEAAHLYSLLSAVAYATLRNDIEGAESPLAEYIPGRPFPPVNPDELSLDIKKMYHESSRFWTCLYFVLGISRSPKQRTLYNAARPFLVIGGISDRECQLLQSARGPCAQIALCNMWLKEFVSREYLNGSTGNVAPPIIGRVYQFISDGVTGYNQCRKIAFVPFPFPHAQITTFFTAIALLIFPFLYVSFINNLAFACVMNFATVCCFVGIYEVARELSNPYFTVPNDLPLNNFQAQFNEALISMYAGFHPDSWREEEENEVKEKVVIEEDAISSAPKGVIVPDLEGVSDEEKDEE